MVRYPTSQIHHGSFIVEENFGFHDDWNDSDAFCGACDDVCDSADAVQAIGRQTHHLHHFDPKIFDLQMVVLQYLQFPFS